MTFDEEDERRILCELVELLHDAVYSPYIESYRAADIARLYALSVIGEDERPPDSVLAVLRDMVAESDA